MTEIMDEIGRFKVTIYVILTYLFCVSWISPGEVGIVVNTLGSDKGIEDKELTVGLNFLIFLTFLLLENLKYQIL